MPKNRDDKELAYREHTRDEIKRAKLELVKFFRTQTQDPVLVTKLIKEVPIKEALIRRTIEVCNRTFKTERVYLRKGPRLYVSLFPELYQIGPINEKRADF
jgi:hypothetical protein